MEAPSHLQQFLAQQAELGQLNSEGEFTLARERALRKIAEFQLPFRSAWVLKVVQSAVAAGDDAPINVTLASREARFTFLGSQLSLSSVEREFYNPEPSCSRSLRHLLSALWAVGLKEGWPFELTFPSSGEALVWDGTSLHRVAIKKAETVCCLTVSPRIPQASAAGWIKEAVGRGDFHAEVLRALVLWCYTSPVPLTVDGRRVDSLYGCPTHGPTTKDFPLTVGFAAADIPPLTIPPGTFEALPKPKEARKFLSTKRRPRHDRPYRQIGNKMFDRLSPQMEAAVPFLLTIHQPSPTERNRATPSLVYWVRDGVVVEEEQIGYFRTTCSVAIFLNSVGLQTDFTSFFLSDSLEGVQRFNLAVESVIDSLSKNRETLSTCCSELVADGKTECRFMAGGIFLFGLAMAWYSLPVGLIFMASGSGVSGSGGVAEQEIINDLDKEISRLVSSLVDAVPGRP